MIPSLPDRALLFAAAALSTCWSLSAQQRVVASSEHAGVTDQRLADTDGDGRQELLLVRSTPDGTTGLARLAFDAVGAALVARGRITLPDPTHTLLAIADLLPAPGQEIVVADPRGTSCLGWQLDDAAEPPAPIVLARRARFALRVDQPQISPFVSDLNQDGRLDLMLPSRAGVQPFLHEGAGDAGVPQFRRMALVPVSVSVDVDAGSSGLDQELRGSLDIQQVRTQDLNGDGRPDLLTRQGRVHKFHLQTADGTFAEPIVVDISQFEDSTPKAAVELGSTIVLGDRQLLQRGDINGDGIPDHVIAHRRKIWSFLSDANGPQFKQARMQAVADDVTFMVVVDLDDNGRADLLTFRVQVPGLGTLLLALVRSIDIDIRAVAYESEADGFARKPKWRRTVTLRVPPILSLLSRQDELVERFLDLLAKTRISARGRFRSAAGLDLAVVQADGKALELLTDVGEAPRLTSKEGRDMMRRLLFEDENTVFDIERLFGLISGVLDSLSERTIGGRKAAASLPLRDGEQWRIAELLVGDLDGADGDELVVVYHHTDDDSRRAYDVVSWR